MATPVAFAEATTVLAPPPDDDEVIRLPVRRVDGALVSCWGLTAAEVDEIVATGVVWISVQGRISQPPVFVTGHKAEVI